MIIKFNILDTDFKIKFDGDQHQIDANLLVNNLIHTTTIIQEINRELNNGKQIEIKIKALQEGSFLIHIDLVATTLDSLKDIFTKDNFNTAGSIITTLVAFIEIKKFLKGDNVKSKEERHNKVKIENKNGDVLYIENFVYNLYENNPVIEDSLAQSFETLENDNSITAYEITDKNENPLIRVDSDEFPYLSIKSEKIQEGEKIITTAAVLNIIRISFDNKLNSDFYYKGNKISIKINNPEFQEKIDNGQPFSKGDILEVELEIKQAFDKSVNTYINKSYKVSKIVKHILRNEQSKLNFD